MEKNHNVKVEEKFQCSECSFKSDFRMPYILHYEKEHMKVWKAMTSKIVLNFIWS